MSLWRAKPKMADKASAEKASTDPNQIFLAPNEVIGAAQRNLSELNTYMCQHPSLVDPMVCEAYLQRAFQFVKMLPQIERAPDAPANGKGAAPEKRAS